MVCASTNQNFAMGSTTVPTLLMNSFAILNVMLIKNLNAIVHLTAFLINGNVMEKETVLMEVTKKIAQNQFVQKANFLAKILTAAALEQPVLILNGFVMARMIVVTGRMKPQTSAYHVHVNRIGENHLLFLYIFFVCELQMPDPGFLLPINLRKVKNYEIFSFSTSGLCWAFKIMLAFFQYSRPSDVLNIQNQSNLSYFEAILP